MRIKADSAEAQLDYMKQQLAEKQSSMAELLISHKELLARNAADSTSQSGQMTSLQTRLEKSQVNSPIPMG